LKTLARYSDNGGISLEHSHQHVQQLRGFGINSKSTALVLELGVQNAILVSTFGYKIKRIRVQAMMPIRIDDIMVDHIFLISPQL